MSSLPQYNAQPLVVTPLFPVQWCLLLLIFSIPFENCVAFGSVELFTGAKFIGILMAILALLQPTVCYAFPPKAFWIFVGYLVIYTIRGLVQSSLGELTIETITTVGQCIILFWISCNLIRFGRMWKSVCWAFVLSNFAVVVLSYMGIISAEELSYRETVLSQNLNLLAFLYALGMLSGMELAMDKTMYIALRIGLIPVILVLGAKCALTGSRGGMLFAFLAIIVYLLSIKGLTKKIRGLIIIGTLAALLGSIAFHTQIARERWELTIYEGHTSGRETILYNSLDMFIERPFIGWGPTTHLWELANRENVTIGPVNTHSDLMWTLTATGLTGGVFFVGGIWMCIRSAWKGRNGPAGVFPLAIIVALSMMCVIGTYHKRKPFWIITAMACASGAATADMQTQRYISRFVPVKRKNGT